MASEIIVVGASRGGVQALKEILRALPSDFKVPLVIVQHRDRQASTMLTARLQEGTAITVVEAEDKEDLVGGRAYLAPPDYHLLVEPGHLALSTEAPVYHARPSIDVLFESAASAYGNRVLAIILTGSTNDGANGASEIEKHGGTVIVQDPKSAEYKEMPEAAIHATRQPRILSLAEIAPFIQNHFLTSTH